MQSAASPTGSDPFSLCVESALALAQPGLQKAVERASLSLIEGGSPAQDAAERKLLVEAGQVLLRQQDTLVAKFSQVLATGFSNQRRQEAKPKAAAQFDFETLEIMGEEQVDDEVELLRAQQSVNLAVEGEVARLNALVSGARGFRVVRVSANPLLPETWVRSLREASLACKVDNALRLRWMQHIAVPFGDELAGIYRQLISELKQQGVQPASFEVNQGAARDSAGQAAVIAATPARKDSALTLRDLRKLLVGDPVKVHRGAESGAGDTSLSGLTLTGGGYTMDPGLTVPAAFEALKNLEESNRIFLRMRERHEAGQWKSPAPGQGASGPGLTPAQVLSSEVTSLMVENIAGDPRLLAPVAELVRMLEGPLLRLAIVDPRFFSDKSHPARELLEEMTTRSLAWSSPRDPGFPGFLAPVREAVQVLLTLPVQDAAPFEIALETLRQVWEETEDEARRTRAATARALQKADARNVRAAKIVTELQARPDIQGATAEVRRFILGPWCQVMAASQLPGSQAGTNPERYAAVVNDLIWSTQPRLTQANPARLAKLVPPMVASLREGLASIDYPVQSTKALFARLAEIHGEALRPDGMDVEPATELTPLDMPEPEDTFSEAWLSASEAQDSALMQMEPPQPDPTDFESTTFEPRMETETSGRDESASIEQLAAAAYVEVKVGEAWVRWRLAWVSPSAMLFMFTNGAGRPESMTRQTLERLMAQDALRLVSERSVVSGALDAVTQTALRNSITRTTD